MRLLRSASLTLGVVALAGCYSLQPARVSAIEPGTQIAFDVTDAGRVALGGSMGPEIGQVEGRLIQKDNGEYLLGVTSVSLLRGGVQTWSGEQVHLKPEYVGNVYERRLDVGHTIAFTAIGVAAVAAIASQSLLGNGSTDASNKNPSDSGATNRRLPRTYRIPVWSVNISRIPFVGRF